MTEIDKQIKVKAIYVGCGEDKPAEKYVALNEDDIKALKRDFANEIFWEIDKLLTIIYTDDEDGRKFIGIDMAHYYGLKKKYTEETP